MTVCGRDYMKGARTYRWYLRHAAVYRGDGWVRENFGAQRRNIRQGHPSEDREHGAWRDKEDPKFLTTLAIYDPFHAYRSKAEKAWLDRGPVASPRLRDAVDKTIEIFKP